MLASHALWDVQDPKSGDTPLIMACRSGQLEIADKLVMWAGADIHKKNKSTNTALHLAALKGRTEIVRMLIETGADIHAQNHEGDTPLMKAAVNGHTETACLLIEAGASLDKKNKAHRTPLMFASHFGQVEFARLLLKGGVEIHEENKEWVRQCPTYEQAQNQKKVQHLIEEEKASRKALLKAVPQPLSTLIGKKFMN